MLSRLRRALFDSPSSDPKDLRVQDGAALLVLFLVWLLPVVEIFRQGLVLSALDTFSQHFPDYLMSARLWGAGHPPLWNPLLQGGMPQLGYVESAAFYPGLIFFRFFRPVAAFNIMIALHWLSLGVGMYVWARVLKLSPAAAFLAGLIALRSDLTIEHIPYSGFMAFAWMPWLGLALTKVGESKKWRHVALGAVVLALPFYGGHPQAWVTWLAACALYTVYLIAESPAPERARTAFRFAAAWSAGFLFSLLQVLPAMAFLAEGPRRAFHDSQKLFVLGEHQDALTFLASLFLNWPDKNHFLGTEVHAYVGLLPFLLAACAVTNRRAPRARLWAAVAALGAALVLGAYTGLPRLLYYVPVLSLLHSTNREALLIVYPLALLAAYGLDSLSSLPWPGTQDRPSRQRKWELLAAAVVGAAAFVKFELLDKITRASWYMMAVAGNADFLQTTTGVATFAPMPPVWKATAGLLVALLAALTAALWLIARRSLALPRARRLLVFAVAMNYGIVLARPLEPVPAAESEFITLETPRSAALIQKLEAGKVPPARAASFSRQPVSDIADKIFYLPREQGLQYWEKLAREMLIPNYSQVFGIPHIGLWHNAYTRSSELDLGVENWAGQTVAPGLLSPKSQLLPMLGVGYVSLQRLDLADPVIHSYLSDRKVYEELLSDSHVSLWRRRDAFPRFWFVDTVRRAPAERAPLIEALSVQIFQGRPVDFRKEAFAEIPPSPAPLYPRPGRASVEIVDYQPNRIVLRTRVEGPAAFLVGGESYDSGWKARIDGASAPIYRTNLLFRGLYAPPGEHTIVLSYRPLPVILGLLGLALGVLVLIAGAFLARRPPSIPGKKALVLAAAFALSAVFLAEAARDLTAPAPTYQEATNVLVPVNLVRGRTLHRDKWISMPAGSKDIFLAYNEYTSMFVETYLLWPLFKLFGPGVAVWRAAGILLALAGWAFYAAAAGEIFGAGAGLLAFALLLFQSTLFLFSRVGFHSELAAFWALSGAMWWCAVKWQKGAGARWAYAACFLAGLGAYEKIQFLWIVAGAAAAYFLAYPRGERRALPRRGWFLFALGAFPLVVMNVVSPLCTVRFLLEGLQHPAQGTSNLYYLSHLWIRAVQLLDQLAPEAFGAPPSGSALAAAFAPIALGLACLWPPAAKRIPRAGKWLLLSVPVYLAISAINGTGLQEYHVLAVIPALLVFAAGALLCWAPHPAAAVLAAGLFLVPHARAIGAFFDYYRTGGRGEQSVVLYDLERACEDLGILNPVGMQSAAVEQLESASGGVVVPRDAARLKERWPEWLARRETEYIVPAPGEFGIPPNYEEHDFAAAALAAGYEWTDCREFKNGEGHLVYSLCRLEHGKAKASP